MKEITLELTNRCMNKCIHCSSKSDKTKKTFLAINKIVEIIEKYNPEQVNLSGGEPTLHSDIRKILLYLKSKNIKVKLYSCAATDRFEEALIEIYECVDVIVFPFYSIRRDIYNNIVKNKYGYANVINGINTAKKLNMNIEIHIVPMTVNINTLDETIRFLIKYGVDKINILKLVVQGRATKDLEVEDKTLIEVLEDIENKYKDKIKLGIPLGDKPCVAGKEKLVLMYNEKTIPCESYKDGICKCSRLRGEIC